MRKDEFNNEVTLHVKERYGDKAEVFTSDVVKNNGLKKCGLCVRIEGSNCGPTIYLDDFYEEYKKGKSFESILDEIIELFEKNVVKGKVDLNFVTDYDSVSDKICYRLVDSVRNEEKLKDMPYRLVEDLAVIYYISLGVLGISGSIAINNKMMNIWGVTEEDLYEAATINTPKLSPAKIVSMGDFLAERAGNEQMAGLFPDNDFLVASNRDYVSGAAVILYPGVTREVAETMGDDYYIIPSSRHEVIMISETSVENGALDLKSMVKCVNETCVMPEDVLSDNLYHYDRTCDNIKKVEYLKDTMVL